MTADNTIPNRGVRTAKSDDYLQHGKVPPQAVDMEEAVLGAMVLEKATCQETVGLLHPGVFYKPAHQLIFSAIKRLGERFEPVDILTVTEELRKSGELEAAGGAYYITMLTNRVASSANIDYHAHIVLQKYIQRELIRISAEVMRDAYEDTIDVLDLQDTAERAFLALRSGTERRDYSHIEKYLREYFKSIGEGMKNKNKLIGVPSGFHDLDRTTGGWQKSNLIILASRPSMGKSSVALTFARNAVVDFGKAVGFFSLEMSASELAQRLISMETKIHSGRLRNYDLEDFMITKISNHVSRLIDFPLYIDDTPALSITELRTKARRMKSVHGVQLIIIDYLQLMHGSPENRKFREREVSEISQSLKALAKELDIPIIALSQLSREVEKRGGEKRPILSDLRESGSIEQDADMVIFLYRAAYYMKEGEDNYDDLKEQLEIIIAKHRNGATRSDIILRFIAQFTLVLNFGEKTQEEEPGF